MYRHMKFHSRGYCSKRANRHIPRPIEHSHDNQGDIFMTTTVSKKEDPRFDATREIHAPTGSQLNCKNWITEAAFRMIQNNLDPEVAEDPQRLVVYGGIGRAARDWECFDTILETLKRLDEDERSEEHTAELQSRGHLVCCL